MGQEDHERSGTRLSKPGLVSSAWRSFQASSGEKFLPHHARSVQHKDMRKGSRADYALNCSEVTPACLLSSPRKMKLNPFLQ